MSKWKRAAALVAVGVVAVASLGYTTVASNGQDKSYGRALSAGLFITSATTDLPRGRRFISIADIGTAAATVGPTVIALKSASIFNSNDWDSLYIPPNGSYDGFFYAGIDSARWISGDSVSVEISR